MKHYINAFKNYATFSGRASRAQYWYFFLWNIIAMVVLTVVQSALGLTNEMGRGIITTLYQLAVIVPAIAIGVRRMHDVNHNGWFVIVPVYNLVLALLKGTTGPNKYGADPYQDQK